MTVWVIILYTLFITFFNKKASLKVKLALETCMERECGTAYAHYYFGPFDLVMHVMALSFIVFCNIYHP